MSQQETKTSRPTPYFIIKIIISLILFAVSVYIPSLQQHKWITQLINGAWTFLIPSTAVSVLRFILISFYNRRHAKKTVRGNFVLGISQLTAILNVAFFLLAFMVGLGINPVEFLTSMTIVAMAIAVTFRDYITNMISGLLIMFSEQLSIGDRIRIGNEKGRVEDITLSNIVLKNEDDDIVMVPNNFFYNQSITNLSVHRSKFFYVKFELPLTVAHHSDELETDLQELLRTHPGLEKENEVKLSVEQIGKDFVKFKMELIAINNSDRLHRQIENDALKRILLFKYKYA
ncbi:mechanosensitive ion channel [Niabella yanshanensis]|uniref:Mechanosensitive ion channel n=1 Tax=Niabella yanshanensis TaxID=577386 RepID=A0ABZ0W8W3_9BACT|nr:mechanosensitive ion channel domain-containing protein [Niabella yanshanensis]WQD39708.1 mechanosensitive ion channel [Niabella yanshanensis]